jgi:hypothetical protein
MKTIEMTATGVDETKETVYEISNSALGIGVIMAMAGLVGIWGVTCIISGLASAGSVQALGRGLITAVTGL